MLNTIWFFAISVWNVMRQTSYLEFWVIFAENWKRNCKMENNGKVFCSRCKSQLRWNNFFFSQNNIFFSKNIFYFFWKKYFFLFRFTLWRKIGQMEKWFSFQSKVKIWKNDISEMTNGGASTSYIIAKKMTKPFKLKMKLLKTCNFGIW